MINPNTPSKVKRMYDEKIEAIKKAHEDELYKLKQDILYLVKLINSFQQKSYKIDQYDSRFESIRKMLLNTKWKPSTD